MTSKTGGLFCVGRGIPQRVESGMREFIAERNCLATFFSVLGKQLGRVRCEALNRVERKDYHR